MRADYERPKKAHKVVLETADGKIFDAEFMMYHGETLMNMMNGGAAFLEIQGSDGKPCLIAKSFIQRLTLQSDEDQRASEALAEDKWRFHAEDPYIILSITSQATDEQVRSAYLKLVRIYHSDKLASMDLPPAMLEYGQEILKKINAAYDMIMTARKKSDENAA